MSGTFNPPANPTVGQTYTFAGATWVWNGTVWTNATTGANFMPLSGGTFTGPISSPGITNGSNAAAGDVGEFISASASQATGSGNTPNILSISLTAGDWDLSGYVGYNNSAAAQVLSGGISTVSSTLPAFGSPGFAQLSMPTGTILNSTQIPVGELRLNLTATTTIYLVGGTTYASGSAILFGYLRARRAR